MSTQFPYYNPVYTYEGYHKTACHCDLRIALVPPAQTALVVLTEVPSNMGTSVTNRSEHLATRVVQEFGFNYHNAVFLEHYPDRGHHLPETYRRVFYTWNDKGEAHSPIWENISLDSAKELLERFGLSS